MKNSKQTWLVNFILVFSILFSFLCFSGITAKEMNSQSGNIKVVVWDERQPKQKVAYENFVGNAIAADLNSKSGIEVIASVGLDDPNQGLTKEILDNCDVLIWWGHVRQGEVEIKKGVEIVERIKAGKLDFIALHASHWATPFIEAMNERTKMNMQKKYSASDDAKVEFSFIPPYRKFQAPQKEDLITPYAYPRKYPNGLSIIQVYLPNCCFPFYRPDGRPSTVLTRLPNHPIAKGVPKQFEVAQTEMYDEPFHIPEPDEVIFEETWPTGEWFRSGMVWNIGKGKLFYFRPGHETYPIYKWEHPKQILENAVRWLAQQ